MILAGCFVALMSWLIPTLLVKVVTSDVIDPREVPQVARWVIDHRSLMPLLGLPAIMLGAMGFTRIPGRWLWVALGLLATLLPMALIVYVFVATVGLLYQYHDLLKG